MNSKKPPPPKMSTSKRYKHIESIVDTKRFTVPDTVVILGSGPNGRAAWPRIPKNAFVIALNEGVNAPLEYPKECAFKVAAWVVNDHNVLDELYWNKANKNFKGIRIFGDSTMHLVRRRYLYVQTHVDAVREGRIHSLPRGAWHNKAHGPWTHDPKIFKPGGTACGAALWVAQIKGPAKRVYMCGVDMRGDVHFNQTEEPARPDPRHGVAEWHSSRPALDERIRHYKELGMEIYTLSETKLQNVEHAEAVE